MEKAKIQFAPNVLLVDAMGLDRTVAGLARYFSGRIGRDLPKADLATLLECLLLDAGLPSDANQEIQVIFVYEGGKERMQACVPSQLPKELNEVGFDSPLGRFSLYAFQPSGMATREELFAETLLLLAESEEAARVLLVPDEEAYTEEWRKALGTLQKKEKVVQFGMNRPTGETVGSFEQLGFSVLQALGIRSDELER